MIGFIRREGAETENSNSLEYQNDGGPKGTRLSDLVTRSLIEGPLPYHSWVVRDYTEILGEGGVRTTNERCNLGVSQRINKLSVTKESGDTITYYKKEGVYKENTVTKLVDLCTCSPLYTSVLVKFSYKHSILSPCSSVIRIYRNFFIPLIHK